LKDISCDDLYKQLKEEKKLQGMNKTLFKYTYTTISANYQSLIKEMKVIKNDIKKTYPNLVKGNAIAPVDFKKLFLEIAKRKEQEYNLKHINQEQNIFDMWNYLHNEHFSIKKSTKSQTYSFKVYDVDKVPVSAHKPNIIGGKAWGLKNMLNLDIPVPKAKVFTTDCCRAYQKNKELYKTELKAVLPTFKTFLNDENQSPILCSVRSGAPISMPGMMDTVLNVGIDDTNYDYFCEKMGKKVTHNCINKFMTLFCSARLGLEIKFPANLPKGLLKFTEILKEHKIPFNKNKMFPLNVERQIEESLHAVFESWNSPRAQAYRIEKNIDHSIGTAAIVQQMVFGNLNENSYTGVVFSRNCLTGENKLVGEFLPKAQGEDVVSGSVTPFSIDKLKAFNAPIYKQLVTIAKKLENQNGQIQDIEFTVEDGTLYILQHRQAVCSPVAAIKLLKDKNLDSTALLKQIDPNLLQKSVVVDTNELENCSGLSANSGVMRGIVIKKESDMEKYKELYNKHASDKSFGWIFYSQLTSPNHMPIMNKTQAFITEEGGFTSHAAIIARSLNKPCVVGLGKTKDNRFKCGQLLTVDGTSGKIWMGMQPVNETTKLAKTAATILMKSHNIDKEQIDEQMFVERIDRINNDHKSWVLNLSNANHVNKIPVKMDKFLDIGQKFAMILAANQRDVKKLKIA
jgi:phosphoenolpyruvate synthase/pyruvate phosphate dikinase